MEEIRVGQRQMTREFEAAGGAIGQARSRTGLTGLLTRPGLGYSIHKFSFLVFLAVDWSHLQSCTFVGASVGMASRSWPHTLCAA